MIAYIRGTTARLAASIIVCGLLGSLAACGGGGGGGDSKTPPPTNNNPTPVVTLQSIEVTPSLPQLAAGTTTQLTATGVYSDSSKRNLTTEVTWASSDGTVATVGSVAGSHGLATAASAGWSTVSASSGGVSGETTLTVTNAALVSIEVSPVNASLVSGSSQQFTATGLYTDNSTQDVTTQVTWASSAGAVATVSNTGGLNGLAHSTGVGTTIISATIGDVAGTVTLAVTAATLVSIEVSPVTPSIANGLTREFTAIGHYSDNSTQNLTTQVTWASSADTVATVSNTGGSKGVASSTGVGTTTVSAASGGVTGATVLTVTDATLVSIEVSPVTPSIANGATRQFTAVGRYTDNSTQDLTTSATWASSEPTVATVSNAVDSSGLATSVGVGSTTVSASDGGVTGQTTLTVTDATLVSIEVSPVATSLAYGLTQNFTAIGRYTDNSTQNLTTQVTWASSDGAVATISNAADSAGLATTAGIGTTAVSAASGDVTGATTLTVIDATLVSIEVTPDVPSVASGLTQSFVATGHYTDGSTQDLTTQVTWESNDATVATISNSDGTRGVATAASAGTTTVSAASGDFTDSTTLTVTDATLVSITVSPDTDSVAKGLTRQFTAVGHYTDNSTQVLTELVTWSSSDNAVATLSNVDGSRGVATTAGVGVATVTAISGGVTGDALLTVTDASLVSIDVSPAVASITSGATQQLAATGHYTDNSTQDLTTQVTWISTDVAIATVSNVDGFNGLATGVGAGTTSVTANKNGLSGSAALTVTGVTPSTLDLVTALLNKVIAVGPGQSLTNHMANVQTYLAIPDIPSACTSLDTFKGVVADQRDKKIDPALADELTADADVIDAAIPCP